ncbi:MAG: stage II sporulation protein P [Oscillospiraceae bacterium]|nr:stage II sporulation protein P [Oscillospiraceae bacterium]
MGRQLRHDLFRVCLSLFAAALLLRGAIVYGPALWLRAQALAADPRSGSFLLYLNTGQILRVNAAASGTDSAPSSEPAEAAETAAAETAAAAAAETSASEAETSAPENTAPETGAAQPTDAAFAAAEADAIAVGGNCTLPYDQESLLLQELPAITLSDGPTVLIVHTHSTEAYTIEPGWEYAATEDCRTLDPGYSVIRVGTEIAEHLEARGIPVLHDTTINDYPSYAGAYDRMEAIIQSYLDEYPSIQMVLDVHRDAFLNTDGTNGATAVDGTARIMLVVGTNEGGLYHPDWQSHLSFALKLQALLNRTFPGLAKPISLCTQRYNQHLTEKSLLVEFGAAGDTLAAALAAADDFSDTLADLLLS